MTPTPLFAGDAVELLLYHGEGVALSAGASVTTSSSVGRT